MTLESSDIGQWINVFTVYRLFSSTGFGLAPRISKIPLHCLIWWSWRSGGDGLIGSEVVSRRLSAVWGGAGLRRSTEFWFFWMSCMMKRLGGVKTKGWFMVQRWVRLALCPPICRGNFHNNACLLPSSCKAGWNFQTFCSNVGPWLVGRPPPSA